MKHQPPYLWMGPRFGVWLELTSDDSHAALRDLADQLCAEFDATIAEKYPSGLHDSDKEYWTLLIEGNEFMLMRLQGAGTSLAGHGEDRIQELVQIARRLGVKKRVGWRWHVWEASNLVDRMFRRRLLRTRAD